MKKITIIILACLLLFLAGCSEDNKGDTPEKAFENRRAAFIEETIKASPGSCYTELIRLKMGIAPDESTIRGSQGIAKLNARVDCADFKLPAFLGILHNYSDSDLMDAALVADMKSAVLNFKYWPDELADWTWDYPANTDSLTIYGLSQGTPEEQAQAATLQGLFDEVDEMNDACYWSENHFILYSSGAYLAAQLYPDETFTASGETGADRLSKFKARIMQWLELRYKSGFSEWLSNVYYNEDMPALLALIELSDDQEIVQLSKMVLDLMMADMALNQFNGTFGSTHGRTYTHKMSGSRDSTGAAMNLMFGLNESGTGNMTASLLAISEKYKMPKVIYEMANDLDREEFINKQRMGIKIEEAESEWGLNYSDLSDLEDGMTFLTLEAYSHPLTFSMFKEMLDQYYWWGNGQFSSYKDSRFLIENPEYTDAYLSNLMGAPVSTGITALPGLATLAEKDLTRNMRTEVNIYTCRTPDYMLSTAQDWRPGYGGDQQSIWQATLGTDATCFTTHPAVDDPSITGNPSPSYWTGYGTLPRAIQVKNVVISLYDVDLETMFYVTGQPSYTHAYLPKAKYDEALKDGNWFFARKGDAYLALYSSDAAADWVTNTDDADRGAVRDHSEWRKNRMDH